MRQPVRHPNALPITLVILLLGMSVSVTIDSGDRAELADDKPALETHQNSTLHSSLVPKLARYIRPPQYLPHMTILVQYWITVQ